MSLIKQEMSLEEQDIRKRLPSEFDQTCHGVSESMFFPFPLTDGNTMIQWSAEYLAPTRDEAKFLAFLSLYGSNGVLLRDLITFATLRISRKPWRNHWLLNGEAGPILRPIGDSSLPTHCAFLDAFLCTCSDDRSLEHLQDRLLSLGLIEIEYPRRRATSRRSFFNEHFGINDERIWRVAKNPMSSHLMVPLWHDQDGEGMVMDLLYVFLEMPSKDVSLRAERYRETYYIHARIFALEALRFCQTTLRNARDYVVALILEILTHRFQSGDNRLIQFVKDCPSSANGFDWAIMVLWAEVKEINCCGGLKIKTALNKSIMRLFSRKGKRQCRANGFIGYLLVEWRKAAEAAQDRELNSRIFKYATDWVETAWSSGSSIERAALCCVLANFGMKDEWVLVPPHYGLLYGYYLSRAGHLEQAKESLALALQPYPETELRRVAEYRFELVSVLIRLGNRQQAKELLHIIEDDVTLYPRIYTTRNAIHGDRLYGHALLSDIYQAELLMTTGEVNHAASQLRNTISTGRREDCYFRSLRLAFLMRLLEVRTWNGSLKLALNVAEALMFELRNNSSIQPDMMQWIIQQSLTLSNRLLWAGDVLAASSLLDKIFNISQYQHLRVSRKDLLEYSKQRWVTVSDLLSADHAEDNPATVGYERKAATNEPLEVLSRSSEQAHSPKKKITDPADIITRAPHVNAEAAATSALILNSGKAMRETSSSTKYETLPRGRSRRPRSITQPNLEYLLTRSGPPEEFKSSDPAANEPTKKASPEKSVTSNKFSRRGQFTRKLLQRGVGRSVVAMLRRAPRAPTTEPGISVVDSRYMEPAPVPVESPLTAELPG